MGAREGEGVAGGGLDREAHQVFIGRRTMYFTRRFSDGPAGIMQAGAWAGCIGDGRCWAEREREIPRQ